MKDRLFLRLSELIGWSEMVYPQAAVLEAPLDSMSCTPNNIVHSSTHTKAWLNEFAKHGVITDNYVLLVHGSHLAGGDVR